MAELNLCLSPVVFLRFLWGWNKIMWTLGPNRQQSAIVEHMMTAVHRVVTWICRRRQLLLDTGRKQAIFSETHFYLQ